MTTSAEVKGPAEFRAELALAQDKVKLAKGDYFGISEDKKLTLRQFASEYLAYARRIRARARIGGTA